MLGDYLRYNANASDKNNPPQEDAGTADPEHAERSQKLMALAEIGAQLENNESYDPYDQSVDRYFHRQKK